MDANTLFWLFGQLLVPEINEKKKHQKGQHNPIFMAEPMRASNSFVGTEEYIAPVRPFFSIFFENELLVIVYSQCL